jgi:hypothetical protein
LTNPDIEGAANLALQGELTDKSGAITAWLSDTWMIESGVSGFSAFLWLVFVDATLLPMYHARASFAGYRILGSYSTAWP